MTSSNRSGSTVAIVAPGTMITISPLGQEITPYYEATDGVDIFLHMPTEYSGFPYTSEDILVNPDLYLALLMPP